MSSTEQRPVTFYKFIKEARDPRRAGRSVLGTLPTRATQYCDAVTSASSFGWWIYPPMEFSLSWDGNNVFWRCPQQPDWQHLEAIQFPYFLDHFDQIAPPAARGYSPPFLSAFKEPGLVQVWSGLFAKTLPDWSLLIRAPANLP